MEDFILVAYFISIFILFAFGSHFFIMLYYYNKYKNVKPKVDGELKEFPMVTIQLPIYNEIYVVRRLLDSVCKIDYPKEKLEVQVLDDSTDETVDEVARICAEKRALGYDFVHLHRTIGKGIKPVLLKKALQLLKVNLLQSSMLILFLNQISLKKHSPILTNQMLVWFKQDGNI